VAEVEPATEARCTRARRIAGASWIWATILLTIGSFGAAIVLAPSDSASPVRGLTWLLFLGSSVHVASTVWLYTRSEVRSHAAQHQRRYIWIPLWLVVGSAIAAAMLSPDTVAWLLLPYFAWQFFHFQKQNLGIVALAASAYGSKSLTALERKALVSAGVAGIAGLVAHPGLLQLGALYRVGWLSQAAFLVFVLSVTVGVVAFARRPSLDRPTALTTIYLVSLLFSLPIFVFASPYAAVGGMTIAHGFQYLLLMGLVAGGASPRSARRVRISLLCTVAVIGGVALGVMSHLHSSSPPLRLLFGTYLGVVMAHFVIDAGFWRMRDPFSRQFLAHHLPYLVRVTKMRAL
jgi:hypothetical protein